MAETSASEQLKAAASPMPPSQNSTELIARNPLKLEVGGLDDLWFSPEQYLVGTKRQGWHVEVFLWRNPMENYPETRSFDLDKLVKLIDAKLSSQSDVTINPPPTFAVARDASKAAFVWGNNLVVKSLVDDSATSMLAKAISANESAVDLAFTQNNLLAVLYRSGRIEFYDDNNLYLTLAQNTGLMNSERLWVHDRLLAAVSFLSSQVILISTARRVEPIGEAPYFPSRQQSFTRTSLASFVLGISDDGDLAVAVGSAEVTYNASLLSAAPSKVRALAMPKPGVVLAAGDFGGIYQIYPGKRRYLHPTTDGIRLLAATESQLAYGDAKTTFYTTLGPWVPVVSVNRPYYFYTRLFFWAIWFLALLTPAVLIYRLRRRTVEPVLSNTQKSVTEQPDNAVPESMGPPALPLPDPPEELIKMCAAGECVLYGGAGLSAQAGLPVWNEFVHGLLEWAWNNGFVDRNLFESYRTEVDAGSAAPVADSVVSKLKEAGRLPQLNQHLQDIFLGKPLIPESHGILRDLNLSAVLTTNFDDLLERTFSDRPGNVFTYGDAEQLLGALTRRDFFILKLYGTLDKPETVTVAPAQYEEAITNNRPFSRFMETLFLSRTLFFVGASLEGIEAYLKSITLPRNLSRKHYALVSVTGDVWRAKADTLERRYGIKVMPYTPTPDHRGLIDFLRTMSQRVAEQVSFSPSAAKERVESARLKKLTLRNIGPFEQLELILNPEWNIILGDNGVGKSSILKAIALAICGEKTQPYAGRLIKSGTHEAFVMLETERKTSYIAELQHNEKSHETEVIATAARPLEGEGWVAVGFPPLRTTNWESSKGPDSDIQSRSNPTTEDLMPLLRGDIDPRLDKLKQWIINLYFERLKSEEQESGSGKRYEQLISNIFEVANKLTHPLTVRYVGVEHSTNRIMVETEKDGQIPIEAVSQGITSLLGWIGVLMQRMYEVYNQDKEPLKQYALVLMDEIDAHMHPAWQQTLVPRLKEIFPNVQFIATTHSPLIVSGMAVRQLFRFTRDGQRRIRQVEVEQDMTIGRADQLLTSELFGLESTRDPETHRLIMRYTELITRDDLTNEQRTELAKTAQLIKVRLPSPGERKEAREAFELIQGALHEKIKAMPSEEKKKLINEAKAQLQEMVTDSRRPL